MIYVYKVNTDYGGLRPSTLLNRLDSRGRIHLGWRQYADVVEPDDEVLVYFHGRSITPGAYFRCRADEVDLADKRVWLRILQGEPDRPLSDAQEARRLTTLVSQSRRQVFILEDDVPFDCSALQPGASSCATRACNHCEVWRLLPRVTPESLGRPERLDAVVATHSAGFWAVPPRSFALTEGAVVSREARWANAIVKSFKSGEKALAYTLAAGIHQALTDADVPRVDALVPIPLSPDKAEAGELDRARAVALQLSFLLRVPVKDVLKLKAAISKRALRNAGMTAGDFERAYKQRLEADRTQLSRARRVLIIDDVCTYGSTLGVAARALISAYPRLAVHTAAGAQMAIRATAAHAVGLITATAEGVAPGKGWASGPPTDNAASSSRFEVVQVDGQWCLRTRGTARPVAWSRTNDEAFRSFCAEAEQRHRRRD